MLSVSLILLVLFLLLTTVTKINVASSPSYVVPPSAYILLEQSGYVNSNFGQFIECFLSNTSRTHLFYPVSVKNDVLIEPSG